MKVVTISPKKPDIAEMLDVLDQLRYHVERGTVIAFSAVSIEADDTSCAWMATSLSVSRLRMQGAIAQLMHNFLSGDV